MTVTSCICGETTGLVPLLNCGHYIDIPCLTSLYQAALRDESLFPPRCCKKYISFDAIKHHLSPAIIDLYQEKLVEYMTPKPVYCSNPSCGRFLGDYVMTERKCTAPGCMTLTCGRCTSKISEGHRHVCKLDKNKRHLFAVGRGRGWVRCPGCEEMVERSYGCFHMTCRCRTQFCYICRALWKSCKCTRFAAVRRQPFQVRQRCCV